MALQSIERHLAGISLDASQIQSAGVGDLVRQLSQLDNETLEDILLKPEELDRWAAERCVASTGGTRRALVDGNRELAESNLHQAQLIEQLRNSVNVIKSSNDTERRKCALADKRRRQEAISEKLDPLNLIQEVIKGIEGADSASKRAVESFREGEIDFDRLVDEYRKERYRYHWREQLRENAAPIIDRLSLEARQPSPG